MDKDKVLYTITVEDVLTVSKETGITFTEEDLRIIQDKISDFMDGTWHEAVEFALKELNNNK